GRRPAHLRTAEQWLHDQPLRTARRDLEPRVPAPRDGHAGAGRHLARRPRRRGCRAVAHPQPVVLDARRPARCAAAGVRAADPAAGPGDRLRRARRRPAHPQGRALPLAGRGALRPHAVRRRGGGPARPQARAGQGPAPYGLRGHRRRDPRPAAGRGGAPARPPGVPRRGPAGGPVSTQGPRPDAAGQPAPSADDALEWRRVHPVTPLVRGWAVVGAAVVILGQQSLEGGPRGGLIALLTGEYWWTVLAALAAVALVGWGYSVLAWRMTTYAIDEETVHLRRGILFRQQRHARLDRLQSVDIRQPL